VQGGQQGEKPAGYPAQPNTDVVIILASLFKLSSMIAKNPDK
jgi:hypothetical protein